ncbi:MAG TPA: CoB--CoM heterodisulfide reductase iron-sulfur subunit A family protein [Actinobacteria bacterium]|nr:CoB--CoM heterodisulfide reductase iron-sulfur subunit A family protein [Actinomycetota bacterium]
MKDKISKIGIFIYDPEGNLGKFLSVEAICSKLSGLHFASTVSSSVRDEGLRDDFEEFVKKNKLSAAVIAGYSSRSNEKIFKNSFKKAGLNPYALAFINLGEAIVICGKKVKILDRAVQLIVRAARWIENQGPIETQKILLNRKVLVLGGGIAGIETALTLAGGGLDVVLVEGGQDLGGEIAAIEGLQDFLGDKIRALKKEEKIKIISSSRLANTGGHAGGFIVKIEGKDESVLEVGAIVVAVGYESIVPIEELGENFNSRVIGQRDFEKRLSSNDVPGRICFLTDLVDEDLKVQTQALLRQALAVKKEFDSDVICLCKDLKVSFDGGEELYKRAREAGVLFFKYVEKPGIKVLNNVVEVSLINEDYPHEEMVFEADLLVVGEKAAPRKGFEELAKLLSVNLDSNGFFQEDNVKILPTKSSKRGVFFVGGCRLPQNINETLTEARATAQEILSFLSKGEIELDLTSAKINSDRCVLCLTCVRTCPHGAIVVDQKEETAKVIPISCQSCGICASECPVMAIELPLYTNAKVMGQLVNSMAGEVG